MAKLRRVHVAIGLVVALAATGACGPERAVAASSLDVFLESAEVRGGDGVTASRLPAGTLRESEPLHTRVLLEAEVETSYAGLLHHEGRAQRAGGDTGLGVTGVCGQVGPLTARRRQATRVLPPTTSPTPLPAGQSQSACCCTR